MEALLILGGALLVLAGLVWLVVLAFGTSLLWGLGSLVPPLTLVFVVRHWRVARKALILSALGFIPLVVGLAMLASQDAQRLAAILELRWLETPAAPQASLDIRLRGELNGAAFKPQHGELVDGLLSLREGQDFFAQREIRIRLPRPVTGALVIDVLPEDTGALPEVEISWLLPGQELPEARRLNSGYTLHLNLVEQASGRLAGDFHLVLPPRYATTLSGTVELLQSGLRWKQGLVDSRFDSRDTLSRVISEYLARRFDGSEVILERLPAVSFPASRLNLDVQARIDDRVEHFSLSLGKSAKQGWRVSSASSPPPLRRAADSAPAGGVLSADDGLFSLVLLLSEPERYLGRSMSVALVRGGSAEGVFTGLVDDGLVRLQRNMRAADAAVFVFHPDDIAHIELIED